MALGFPIARQAAKIFASMNGSAVVRRLAAMFAMVGIGFGSARAQPVPAPAPAPVPEIRLTAPKDYQVNQRSDATHGAIVIEGEWALPRRFPYLPDALEARVLPPNVAADAELPWKPLPFMTRARGFRATVPAAPGAWYRVQVRLLHEGSVMATTDITHVGVGEVFVIAGQSNSANYGEERQKPESDWVVAFDGAAWAPANDPQPGATGTKGSFIPSFGDALVRALHVPIGVVCVGVGSTSVREWLPAERTMSAPPTTGSHVLVLEGGKLICTGELFDKLTDRLRHLGPGGARAVLWHQGESDWKQPPEHEIPLPEFRADLTDLISSSRKTGGWDVPWIVAQVSYGSPNQPGAEEMRAQQLAVVDNRLTFAGPNTDTLTGALREKNGQGVHFSAEGQKRHGEMWAKIVGKWIEGQHK
jgi:hypothetical protein